VRKLVENENEEDKSILEEERKTRQEATQPNHSASCSLALKHEFFIVILF
jgi:hypothetical protein